MKEREREKKRKKERKKKRRKEEEEEKGKEDLYPSTHLSIYLFNYTALSTLFYSVLY